MRLVGVAPRQGPMNYIQGRADSGLRASDNHCLALGPPVFGNRDNSEYVRPERAFQTRMSNESWS
jgi:hypothetical protein